MKMINGKLYFKTPDIRAFLGITDGQIWAARERNALNPIQFSDGGDCFFKPEEILEGKRQLVETGRLGSSKLRRKPVIEDKQEYARIVRYLERSGYAVGDVSQLEAREDGKGYKVVYDPTAVPVDDSATATSTENVSTDTSESSGGDMAWKNRPTPDVLPFNFAMGSDEVPEGPEAKHDFKNVQSCFGYADETNTECSENCAFFEACAKSRFRIMSTVANGLDKGKDAGTIREEEAAVRKSEIERVAALI
jgi:hypothetical protein